MLKQKTEKKGKINRETIRDGIICNLAEYPWELYCSMNLPYKCDHSYAVELINKWRVALLKRERFEIGYTGIFDPIPRPHVHLMVLNMKKRGRKLSSKTTTKAEEYWASITRQSIFIKPVSDMKKVITYILGQNTPSGLFEKIATHDYYGFVDKCLYPDEADYYNELWKLGTNLWPKVSNIKDNHLVL